MEDLKELYALASSYEILAIKERERADAAWRALELKQKAYDRLVEKLAKIEAENAMLKDENDRLFNKTLEV